LPCRTAQGYVEAPHSLGKIVNSSTMIVMVRVKSVDRTKNLIVYTKVRDVRGTFTGDEIKHNIGKRGFHPRESKNIMAWARVGKMALFFTAGGHGEMCIDNYWYQCGFKGWATMTHAEPYFLRAFAGRPEKLATYVTAMLAGQEVVVPCMVDGDRNAIQLRTAKIQRLRASMKINDYNPKRDFVGWGAEDFRPITGMPGFTHYSAIGKFSPGAAGVAPADFNGDGKIDLCIFGDYRLAVLKNDGGILSEEAIPTISGARAVAWGDYDFDGKIDLLVASATGPRLLKNNIKQFVDATSLLPLGAYNSPRAAAIIDYDGDKKPDILLADGFLGLRLYQNAITKGQNITLPSAKPWFIDVSDSAGLGVGGICGNVKGDHFAVADVNGDKRADVLYSAETGVLLLNTPKGFVRSKDSGISYRPGRIAPVFGDYNGDGHPDLFIPQKGTCKLLKNDGRGRFTDVTAASGDLAKPVGWARCAAWTDFNRDGRLDLFIGCLKGPNRYLQGKADGTFTDVSESIGLTYRIYNTCGLAVADINTDDMPDVVFNNEGQATVVLLGNPAGANGARKHTAVSALPSASALAGASLAGGGPDIAKLTSGSSKLFYWLAAIVLAGILGVIVWLGVVRHLRLHHAGGRIENKSHQKSEGLV